jgi:hypothetical protein
MTTDPRIEALAAHFAASPAVFDTSPLYQVLGPAVAADETLLELLTRRRPGQQASFLLFGAVHRLLLAGADHRLRDYYPSVVGPAAADPAEAGPVFLDFCRQHRGELEELIATRLVQSNVVRRAIGLRYALWAVARRWAGPVHLIEVGASAGLLLNVDRYRYQIGRQRFGRPDAPVVLDARWRGTGPVPDLDAVPPIAGRIGIDLNPVDLADEAERAWLRALVWPEQREAAALLEAAIDEFQAHPATLLAGDAIEVCRKLGAELPAGQARVVFHAATRMHVPAERRQRFDEAIDSLGADGPLFHVWIEPPSAPHHGYPVADPDAVALHGPGDEAASAVVRADGHLHWLEPIG